MSDDEYDEPAMIDCRTCGTVDEPHECPYVSNEAMSEDDERDLLALLNATPLGVYRNIGEPCFTVDQYQLGAWTVAVFFDGVGVESWDYIEWVNAPNGKRYHSWPDREQNVLPNKIANWSPDWPRPSFVSMIGKLLGEC